MGKRQWVRFTEGNDDVEPGYYSGFLRLTPGYARFRLANGAGLGRPAVWHAEFFNGVEWDSLWVGERCGWARLEDAKRAIDHFEREALRRAS